VTFEPPLRLRHHRRGEIEGQDPPEPADQMGQERAGAAPEVDDGLRAGVGHRRQRLQERALDIGMERVEKQLVVPRRGTAPMAVLVVVVVV
jgi:hypothetical protein